MKGPFQRLKHDLRRLWECPVCHHRAHTPGHVTSCMCRCQMQADAGGGKFMQLIEGETLRFRAPTPEPPPPDLAMTSEATIQPEVAGPEF